MSWTTHHHFWKVKGRVPDGEEWDQLEGWDLWYEITVRPQISPPYKRWMAVIV